MAIGWFSVLKMVPWAEVIDNAPKVAQGAKRLWNAVGKKPAEAAPTGEAAAPTLAGLQVQLADLQVSTAELHQQMRESSALIQSLAEQNTQLIRRLEINRRRILGLTAVVLCLTLWLALRSF